MDVLVGRVVNLPDLHTACRGRSGTSRRTPCDHHVRRFHRVVSRASSVSRHQWTGPARRALSR
jgi:hypothetical protein